MPAEERQLSNIMSDLPSITIDNAELLSRDKDTGAISKVDGKISNITQTATEADLKAGNYLVLDGAEGTKRLPADAVAKAASVKDIVYSLGIQEQLDAIWNDGYYIINGFKSEGEAYACTDYIEVLEGLTIKTNAATFDNAGYSFYTAKSEGTRFGYASGSPNNVVVPEGAKYIRLSTKKSLVPSENVHILAINEDNDTFNSRIASLESYTPKISELYEGVGLVKNSTIVWNDGYYINNGFMIAGNSWNCTDYIEVLEGLTIKTNTVTTGVTGYSFYTAKSEGTRFNYAAGSPNNVVVPEGAKYIRFTMRVGQVEKDDVFFRQKNADPNTIENRLENVESMDRGVFAALGDSITEGTGASSVSNSWFWKLRQKLISDKFVTSSINLGSGGNNSNGITAYAGGRGLYLTSQATIPASGGVSVNLSARIYNAGNSCYPSNPCYLGGIKGNMTHAASGYTFTRENDGESRVLPVGEPLITMAARMNLDASFMTIMIGCNDAQVITDSVADNIIANAERCAKLSKNGKYIVIGHYTNKDSSDYLINLYREKFGQRFVDMYGYLSSNGVVDAVKLGVLPEGSLQENWFNLFVTNDNIHPNDAGHAMFYHCIYNRLKELGWI